MELIDLGLTQEGEALSEAILNQPVVYDMMCMSTALSPSVNVSFEDIEAGPYKDEIPASAYAVILKGQLDAPWNGVEAHRRPPVKICGETYECVSVDAEDYSQYYYVRRLGKYMAGVVITLTAPDAVEDVLACFA